MNKNFIHKFTYRTVSPIAYGTVVYIMVLLIFDRAGNLAENFELFEWLLCLILTYGQFEATRLLIIFLDKKVPFNKNIKLRLFAQFGLSAVLSILIVSAVISAYFIYLVQFSSFLPELYAFNSLLLAISIFHNLLYTSIYFLGKQNDEELAKEHSLRKTLEFQLQAFKNEINPELLYSSLETIISLLHQNPKEADNFINQLSTVYRYTLDNKQYELAQLTAELKAVDNLLKLLNIRHHGNLSFSSEIPQTELERELIPGTLPMLVEHLVRTSIVSSNQPLHIRCYLDGENILAVQSRLNERIKPIDKPKKELKNLQKAYSFYTSEPVVKVKAYDEVIIKVPLLQLELEEEVL